MWRKSIHRCVSSQNKVITHIQDFKFSVNRTKLTDEELTPIKIFEYLDRRVVGQHNAKRALAIAYSSRK
jgi:ATP-dependent protease Clp ATPase subunit